MLTDQQKAAIQAASLVLQMAGVNPWFEARIIRDSTKQLNGKRISSKKRTDLESVLRVVEEKRVNMLPDMRIELRMYATAVSSRSVFMGQGMVPDQAADAAIATVRSLPSIADTVRPAFLDGPLGHVEGRANFSASKNVERLKDEGAPEYLVEKAQRLVVVSKDDVPRKRNEHVEAAASFRAAARMYDPGPPNLDDPHTSVVVLPGMPANPSAPLAGMRTVATHTCDTNGPMMRRSDDGPFFATCSLCGELVDEHDD